MLALLLIAVPVFACYELLGVLVSDYWHPTLLLSAAVPIGFITTAWFHFFAQLLSPLGRSLSNPILSLYFLIGVAAQYFHRRKSWQRLPDSFYYLMFFLFLMMLWACHVSFLHQGLWSQGTTYSDLPFHMNLITSFAYGVNSNRSSFWPFKTTFYAFERLIYPIIPDYHSTVLVSVGASVRMSIFLPSLMLSMSVMCALYHLARQFSATPFVPELAVLLFCFAGGDGWKRLLRDPVKVSRHQDMNTNYAHNFGDYETFWVHTLIHFMFPQRSAMFTMTLCLVTAYTLIECSRHGYKDKILMFTAGCCVSLIPMASGHSFLAICLLAAILAVQTCPWLTTKKWFNFLKAWIIFSIPIILIGLPQSVVYVGRAKQGNFIGIEMLWRDYGGPGLRHCLVMWWESLSNFLYLSLIHCWFSFGPTQTATYIPPFVVFWISNFVRFQPGAMDNTKVFIAAWYPLACAAVAHFLIWFAGRRPRTALALAVAAMASGTLCVVKSLAFPFPVFSPQELDVAKWAIENTPLESVFLTTTYPGIPVTAIAGRTALMTFPGWAWTHGIFDRRRTELTVAMWATGNPELFVNSSTDFVLKIQNRQKEEWKGNINDPRWLVVFAHKDVEVWEVVEALLPEAEAEEEEETPRQT
jgi:hypothetical protein